MLTYLLRPAPIGSSLELVMYKYQRAGWLGQAVVVVSLLIAGVGCSTFGAASDENVPTVDQAQSTSGDAITGALDGNEKTDGEPLVAPKLTLTLTGAAVLQEQEYLSLAGKRVGLVANQASVLGGTHLVDLFSESNNVDLVAIFAPEHGWRGSVGAGEKVLEEIDPKTGLPVFSLYGTSREPTTEVLSQIDLLVFDLQDVGARYFTYISTMGLAMQAAAQNDVEFMVLDRPNPRGGRLTAGPIRTRDKESFVSQYPIPTLYGLTAGELANAIVGEKWLPGLDDLVLTVVEMENWDRQMMWADTALEWISPSPGLPTEQSALIYPATVLFEATTLSYGRGTDYPFSQVGAPWIDGQALAQTLNDRGLDGVVFEPTRFTPEASSVAADPQYEGVDIAGVRISVSDTATFEPVEVGTHLLEAVLAQADSAGKDVLDRSEMFDLLAGSSSVRTDLTQGKGAAEIVASWQQDIDSFDSLRTQYQIYD